MEVGAFAPGAYISRSLCKSVTHYVSKVDPVPNLDKSGRARCKDTIITLQPHPKAAGLDHSFTSQTYAPEIEKLIENYMAR